MTPASDTARPERVLVVCGEGPELLVLRLPAAEVLERLEPGSESPTLH